MSHELSRRRLLGLGLVLGGVGLGSVGVAVAAPSGEAKRISARLELWSTFARQSTNLLARYTSTRSSPLLREELVGSGELAFVAPNRLILRDDGATGSTTRIEPREISITPNDPSLPGRPLPPVNEAPALRWLADRLVASFAPGDGSALTRGARVEAPPRRSKLVLLPPRDSAARALIRSVTLTLDQVGGAVVRIEIAQSDGGVHTLAIADHRQMVEAELVERVFADRL